jgi:excisionase family DNA binding protein
MKNDSKDRVMTLNELASYLNVPKSTIYTLAQEGRSLGKKSGRKIGRKIGKQWRFAKAAIDRWLDTEAKKSRTA